MTCADCMLAAMAEGNLIIEHPNRDKAESRATRAVVVGLLLVSTAVLLIATIGGWEKMQGAKPVLVAYTAIYALLAFYIARWRSGMLPVAASLAIILLIFCAISGPQWFARDEPGFTNPLLDESVVGALTLAARAAADPARHRRRARLLAALERGGRAPHRRAAGVRRVAGLTLQSGCARVLELEYRIGSKPIAREGLWVRIPPRVSRPDERARASRHSMAPLVRAACPLCGDPLHHGPVDATDRFMDLA